MPCSIDRVGEYALAPALEGPVSAHGAPLYILHHDELVSTILPQADLGLANFEHNHKAVLHKRGDKLCIIVQAWNPGNFAILEQVQGFIQEEFATGPAAPKTAPTQARNPYETQIISGCRIVF